MMTGMASDTTAAPAGPHDPPHPYNEQGLARLMLSHAYKDVAEGALSGISPRADQHAEPGEFIEHARQLLLDAEDALRWAVVYERERGTSWDDIGDALGPVTRQSAHRKFADQVGQWRTPLDEPETVRSDGTADDTRIPYPASDPESAAGRLDHWLLEHTAETDSWYGSAQPVSRHLLRHTTLTALLLTERASHRLLQDQLVPDPHRQADVADRHADLLERLIREGGADRFETAAHVARDRARARALRQIPGTGVPWEAMSDPEHRAGESLEVLEAETAVLTCLAPFLALNEEDAVLTSGETTVFENLRAARDHGDTKEAAGLRPPARAIAAELVASRPRWLDVSEAGWALHEALLSYALTTTKKPA